MCTMGDTVVVSTARGPVDVDSCIAQIVDTMNRAGLATVASCCGHGHRPGVISLADGRELVIARDYDEARSIERLFATGANGEPVKDGDA